jgi:hypothetical protein
LLRDLELESGRQAEILEELAMNSCRKTLRWGVPLATPVAAQVGSGPGDGRGRVARRWILGSGLAIVARQASGWVAAQGLSTRLRVRGVLAQDVSKVSERAATISAVRSCGVGSAWTCKCVNDARPALFRLWQ